MSSRSAKIIQFNGAAGEILFNDQILDTIKDLNKTFQEAQLMFGPVLNFKQYSDYLIIQNNKLNLKVSSPLSFNSSRALTIEGWE